MDKQATFEFVARHLFRQGCRATIVNQYTATKLTCVSCVSCVYRGPNGLKCAVGCLIPEKLDGLIEENITVRSLKPAILDAIGVKEDDDVTFLGDLQLIHDNENNWTEPCRLKASLARCASTWELDYGFLEDLAEFGQPAP